MITTESHAPRVSVVIPSYNRKDSVLALLEDIYRQEGVSFEVIVVDDCSPDGSAEAIASAFPHARLFINETNGGPCVARNRGIRAAQGEIIVGFDSDVRVPDKSLLARVFQSFTDLPAHVHCLAFRLLQPDGISEDKARWWHSLPIEKYADQTFETNYFSGTGYAFRRVPVTAVGLFPEMLYMHYEEVELAWRIIDNEGTIVHCPNLAVLHHEHQVSRRSEIRSFYKARNQILLAVRCLPKAAALKWIVPRLVFQFAKACRAMNLSGFIQAMRSAVSLMPVALKARKPLQRLTLFRIGVAKSRRLGAAK
jgi:GT2 family glycosyltransferase